MSNRRPLIWTLLAAVTILGIGQVLTGCFGSQPQTYSGYVEAELLHISPLSGGTLEHVAVMRGQRVESGQPLFEMDSIQEQRLADVANARHERSTAQLADLNIGRRPLEVEALQQQVHQAEAALTASLNNLRRHVQLVDQGFVSAARLDELHAQREGNAARVHEAKATLALAQQAARHEQIRAAAADRRAALADAELARWRQSQTRRVAPRAGFVFDVLYRPGETVMAGTPVVSLLPDGALKVQFFVPEPQLPQAAIGTAVQITCDGCAPQQKGVIRWVSPQAEYTPPVLYSEGSRAKLVFRVEAEPLGSTTLRAGQPVDVLLLKEPVRR